MVFLVLTRRGYDELAKVVGGTPSPLWIADGVLTADELKELRSRGLDVTHFSYAISPNDAEQIEDALQIVAEHHPDQTIWVERSSDA